MRVKFLCSSVGRFSMSYEKKRRSGFNRGRIKCNGEGDGDKEREKKHLNSLSRKFSR